MLKIENAIHFDKSGTSLVARVLIDQCKDEIVTKEFSFKNGQASTKVKVPNKTKDCKGPNMPINLIVKRPSFCVEEYRTHLSQEQQNVQ